MAETSSFVKGKRFEYRTRCTNPNAAQTGDHLSDTYILISWPPRIF